LRLHDLLDLLFGKKKPAPTPVLTPILTPIQEPEDVPPPPLAPISIVDILTSSGQYPGRMDSPECTPDVKYNAAILCDRVNKLLRDIGITQIGQVKINSGFRTKEANALAGGAPASKHMLGMAVDIADHDGSLEQLITDELLVKHDLYRENQHNTHGWVHLDTAPRRTRTFSLRAVK
jgi:hypothetical protein